MNLNSITRFFKDKNGRIVIWQWPNAPILAWAVLSFGAHLFTKGKTQVAVQEIARAFLFVWAYLELTEGESYFRRALGAVVLAGLIRRLFI